MAREWPPPSIPKWGLCAYKDNFLEEIVQIDDRLLSKFKSDPLMTTWKEEGRNVNKRWCKGCEKFANDDHLEVERHQKQLRAFWALWDQHGDQLLSGVDAEAEFFGRLWKPWKQV